MLAVQLLVLAKAPVPGKVKTRLCPPLTPAQAADVARAAIEDTLAAVRATPVQRRVLVVDGDLRAPGFHVQPQSGGALDERLAAAFDDAAAHGLPALLVGMDTPQVRAAVLTAACRALLDNDAVLGLAEDGGWWALGLQRPDGARLRGIPTSRDDTGRRQAERLADAGLRTTRLPVLRDVDTVADARAVAATAPGSRFAAALEHALGVEARG
jgi:rSAM/selenodomain-associated transferase 1